MSSAFGLVKFNRTGNIYYCCYNGTSDIMIPFLCTPEECYDEKIDCYCAITYCKELNKQHDTWKLPDNTTDLDDIEIYSDYGGGFFWDGTGSESAKMIDDGLNPYCDFDNIIDGIPEWAEEFLNSLEKN